MIPWSIMTPRPDSPPERSAGSLDLLRIHLAVAGFGFAGIFGKLLLLPPVLIVAGRAGFATLSLGVLLLLRPELRTTGAAWRAAWPLGVLLALHWWLFFQAVQVSTVAVALVSFSAFPALVILWEALEHRAAPASRDLLAALVALVGVGVIVPTFDLASAALRGALWGLASGGAFAAIVVVNRRQALGGSPWGLALIQNAVACLVLLPIAALQGTRPSPRDWLILAGLGMVLTGGTHGLFLAGLRSVPARLASLVCTLEPAYGILAGFLVLKEVPAPRTLLGAALVIVAVIGVTLDRGARRLPDEPARG
jgi:drug/metabolite transporter (DMT)-like permease